MRRAPRPHVLPRRALLLAVPIAALSIASCTIHVVGTATSDYGVFNVEVSL